MNIEKVNALLKSMGISINRVKIWSEFYFPFVMGGSVWQPAWTWAEAEDPTEPHGRGFFVQKVFGPIGQSRIIEASSGAIVGKTIEQVSQDILEADPAVMQKQVEDARRRFASYNNEKTQDAFWNALEKAKSSR